MALSRESPNSRLNAIRKFVRASPPRATRLRLLVSDPPLPLGEWEAAIGGDDQRMVLAEEIEQLMLDNAAENPRYRAAYVLAWCDGEGGQITVKPVSVYSHQLRQTPEDSLLELDGTATSQVMQAQRHLEAMTRIYIQGHMNIISTLAQSIDRLAERNAHIETAHGARHDELLDAKETILGLLNEQASTELTPAQVKAFELLEKLGPSLVSWMQSQARNAPKNSNPKPNGKANGSH